MNEEIKEYIEKFPSEISESFVRLIPFKDQINIEANAIINYKEELKSFKITPKGFKTVYLNL